MFTIETATAEDFTEIMKLDSSLAEFSHNGTQYVDSALAWRVWLDGSFIYKAEACDGRIIGAIVAFPVKNRGWCIHKILIANDFLQENVAKRLLKKFLVKLDKREEKSYVIIHTQDLYSLKLYSSLGFTKQSRKKDYLGSGEHRFMLTRPERWVDVVKSKKKHSQILGDSQWNSPAILGASSTRGNSFTL